MTTVSARAGAPADRSCAERLVPEGKASSNRSPYARDRARVLHSAALRRLAAKTQVVVPWESDFPRTRLTHSLECGQIGRELGASLGCDPDLVETACLAHDLGHPPFGHNGEAALNEVASSAGGFEGNAQSFRILTRLESKVVDDEGAGRGLNLTRGSLDAATKYPWPRSDTDDTKFGVYDDDLEVFRWVRVGASHQRLPFEAQVMDWADDVAYSVHDLEDAVHAGHLVLDSMHSTDEQRSLAQLAAQRYAIGADETALQAALQRLLQRPSWPRSFDGTHDALVALKAATSDLIGRFCQAAMRATREQFGPGHLHRYAADLLVPDDARLECAMLKAATARYVMSRSETLAQHENQRAALHELCEALLRDAPSGLEPQFAQWFVDAVDDASRLRVVVDQVASLTDPAAWSWRKRLTDYVRR